MKIKIPVFEIVALLGKIIKAAKGGISKDEALDIATDLAAIAASVLTQVAEKEPS